MTHHLARGEYKYSGKNVPVEIRTRLDEIIEDEGLECADRFRFTPMDDDEGMHQFEFVKDGGCCGSFERIVEDATGRKWLIGCNYGH